MTVPDLLLERHHLGEVTPAEAEQLTHQTASDPAVHARVAALRRDDEVWLASPDPVLLIQAVRSRRQSALTAPRPPFVRWAIPIGAAAVVVMAALAISLPATAPPPVSSAADDGDRIKGIGASLAIYRRTDAGSEQLADGASAHEGDVVRIGYRVAKGGYGVILSIDGRGQVTLHLPANDGRAVALDSGGQVLLDRAFELDDAPVIERFHFIAGPTPFAVAPIIDAVRAAGAAAVVPGLDPALDHATLELRKDARP
jgi:hypothetical protein